MTSRSGESTEQILHRPGAAVPPAIRGPLSVPTLVVFVIIHLGVLWAPATFSWHALGLAALLHYLLGGLGICLGYHRLLTHRSFSTPRWLEYLLVIFGGLSLQGGPITWVADHRIHHGHSDKQSDPHSPQESFLWGHMLWMLFPQPMSLEERARYAPELWGNPFYRFLERWHLALQFPLAALLWGVGGWPFVVYGVFVRLVVVYHCTWLINSACHRWGYRSFPTPDDSRNLWWAALLTWGEGWHNNHHANPTSARHGLRWWEVDPTFLAIRLLEALGLARDVERPTGDLA